MTMRKWFLSALLCSVSGAFAGPFTFQQVSNSNDGFLDDYVAPAYNDNGVVAFWGSYAATSGSGLFTANAPAYGAVGPLSTVVDSSGIYSSFTHGQIDINNAGHISFHSNLDNGESGIFFFNGSTATNIFDTTDTWSDLGESVSVGFFPQLNDNDQVTFISQFPVNNAAFLWENGTVTEVARGGPTAGTGFNGYSHHVDINNSGLMVAQTQSGWQTLVTMTPGNVDRIVNDGVNPNPSGFPYFTHIGTTPVINSSGLVAFSAVQNFSNLGLYLTDGNTMSQIYSPTAGHSLYETFSLNDAGNALFMEIEAGTNHNTLYAWYNGQRVEILKSGDTIEGKVVDQIRISSNALNNNDELAIYANFFDGSVGVYVAGLSAIPEPASLLLLCGGTLAIWRRRRRTAA